MAIRVERMGKTHTYDTQMILVRTVTVVTWLAVGASAVAWWLHGWRADGRGGPEVPVAVTAALPPADWSVLWGRPGAASESTVVVPMPSEEASRLRLVGLAGAARAGSHAGVALVSIDGKPPRALRVGDRVGESPDDPRVVLDITGNTVAIGVPGRQPSIALQAQPLPPP